MNCHLLASDTMEINSKTSFSKKELSSVWAPKIDDCINRTFMASIDHMFHIDAPIEKVFRAITSIEGLQTWWTTGASGETQVGGTITFPFADEAMCVMNVHSKENNKTLAWKCVEGPDDWVGTELSFELASVSGKTRVRFTHGGWKQQNDFFANCNFSWGKYLRSLRQLCETGKGAPFVD